MLVHFSSKHSADFFLFERDAKPLFELMGKPLTAQGILAAESAASTLATLELGLTSHAAAATGAHQHDNDSPSNDLQNNDAQDTPSVSLKNRAYPLREMLRTSIQKGDDILWEMSKG